MNALQEIFEFRSKPKKKPSKAAKKRKFKAVMKKGLSKYVRRLAK